MEGAGKFNSLISLDKDYLGHFFHTSQGYKDCMST